MNTRLSSQLVNTVMPMPIGYTGEGITGTTTPTALGATVYQINIPNPILVHAITLATKLKPIGLAGNLSFAIYEMTGNILFSKFIPLPTTESIQSVELSEDVLLKSGNYYVLYALKEQITDVTVYCWSNAVAPMNNSSPSIAKITATATFSPNPVKGRLTILEGVIPNSFNPKTDLATLSAYQGLFFRLDSKGIN